MTGIGDHDARNRRSAWPECATTAQLVFGGALAVLVASCGDGSSPSPTSPTPLPPTAPIAASSFSVAGTVSEVALTGLTSLAGAQVTIGGVTVTTNAQGFYTFLGLETGALSITASKVGYKSETRSANFPPNARQGNMNVDLVRESDLYTLSGVVSELTQAGLVGVEGVSVDVMSCNAVSAGCLYNVTQTVRTDRTGSYRLRGLYAGKNNFLWVTKEDYEVVGRPPVPTCDYCNGTVFLSDDTILDLRIARPTSR